MSYYCITGKTWHFIYEKLIVFTNIDILLGQKHKFFRYVNILDSDLI